MNHFNWTELLPGISHDSVHVATAGIASLIMVGLALVGRASLGSIEKDGYLPAERLSIKGFFEFFMEFIIGLSDMVVGEKGRRFAPMFASIFFYVWINNLLGLIPGMTPATENINTNIAVGVFSFLAYNLFGLKEHGVSYLKHFFGPLVWMAPLIFLIELISHFLRPLTLGLRLQGNMMGDHTVLAIFLDMVPVGIPAIFYGLGVFVCSMQAFIFTTLSMVYVAMAISHDH